MGLSLPHLLILAIYLLAVGIPVAKILQRLGYSRALTIIAFIPLVNVVGLWLLAHGRWSAVHLDDEVF